MQSHSRRSFLAAPLAAGALAAGSSLLPQLRAAEEKRPLFDISLAQWSLNKALFGKQLDNLDFPRAAKRDYGIGAVEFVNQFFPDKAKDQKYLAELKQRADDEGVKCLLIMIDREGALGDPDPAKRTQAVENHYKWIDAAKFLGCHSIRVNAQTGSAPYEEARKNAIDGLRRLSEYGAQHGLNVIVENHGGLSSNGAWLASVLKGVELSNCGSLPDFGNFRISNTEQYDRYKGVAELMPFAKGVSAKSHDFDADGNEKHTDFLKMMKIVLDAGYRGYVGIEYEGKALSEPEGIRATKKLLERVREQLSA